jgi:hypothetical protein
MFTVTSNTDRNRLYITLAGHMEGPERQEALRAILAAAAGLAPGFGVVSDIASLHPSNEEGFRDLLRVKAALKLKGAGPIVRVVKIALSRIQIERISEASGYHAEHVGSLEEADQYLDAMQGTVQVES